MLQFPTNVYPHNVAVEINPEHPFTSSYTFNGDLLRWGLCDYYDNVTGERVLHSYFPRGGNINTYYNGDTVNINHKYTLSYFKNGYDYKYRYTLFQSDPTEAENNDDSDGGLYNIFLLESYFWKAPKTMQYSSNGVYDTDENGNRINYQVVYVDGELSNIKPAYYYTYNDGRVKLVGGCYVEIDHERRFVEHVVKTTITRNGENVSAYALYLTSPFNTTPTDGTRFRIFCNYVMSPFYFFKARKDPVISNMDAELVFSPQFAIQCDAKYQQANNVTMKYHRWYLYKCNHYEAVLGGNGYVRDLTNEYNQASTVAEQNNIEQLINSIDSQVLPIATGLGDIVGKTIVLSSGIADTSDFRYTSRIKAYNTNTGLATLSIRLPITPIATTTNNPDNINETTISYEIIDSVEQLVGDSGALYDYDMPYTFYEFPLAKNELGRDVKFKVRLEVCTQDGKVVYKDIYKTFVNSIAEDKIIEGLTDTPLSPIVDMSKRAIHLQWKGVSGCRYAVYRQRVDKTESETPLIYFGSSTNCYDYLVGNGKRYKYHIVPIYGSQIGVTYTTQEITPKWCGWSIAALNNANTTMYGKSSYLFDDTGTWILSYDKQSGTITQNQSRNTHIGINSYPRVSIDSSSYITGSFEAMLGNYDFNSYTFDDYIAKVERWRDFMSADTPYLLKTTKGDVWIVNITSEPTTTYDESLRGVPTSISFEFTECENINNITIT